MRGDESARFRADPRPTQAVAESREPRAESREPPFREPPYFSTALAMVCSCMFDVPS
jgi:hypothetical protein